MSVIRILAAGSLVALVGGVIPGAALAAAGAELPKLAAPKADNAETPPPIPASAEAGAVWYVVIDGQKVGPLTEAALLRRMASGEIDASTLVWRSGMDEWQTIAATETIMAKRVAASLTGKPKTPLDGKFGSAV